MKLGLISMVVTGVLLLFPSMSSAHDGNVWFQTITNFQRNIAAKYQLETGPNLKPKCWATTTDRARGYSSHSTQGEFGAVRYDHAVCLVVSEWRGGRVCWVFVHQTGPKWADIVLTTYSRRGSGLRGCTPSDLRRR